MARKLKDGLLKAFAKYTENTEIPSIFALWVGISTISSAMGRDCFVNMGHFSVYANMYVVLVAGSAKCRKSTSIGVGRKFMENMVPRIKMLSQKMTPEALIGALSGMTSESETKLLNEAEGILVVDELSTLIDRNAFKSGMIAVLTKLYDCDDFVYETRSRGAEHVRNPCLSILGGSTADWIKEAVPPEAIGGGFTSRVVFVFKDSFERLVAWPELSEETIKLGKLIEHDLNEVGKMRGPFILDKDARQLYEDEYKRFMHDSDMFQNTNLAGYAGRRHITLLKVSMVISSSVRDSRKIDRIDMSIAVNAMKMVEEEMPRVLKAIRNEFVGDVSEEVLNFIMGSPFVYRSTLVKKMSYKLSAQQLNIILDTLLEYRNKEGYNIITIEKDGNRTKYIYRRKKKS